MLLKFNFGDYDLIQVSENEFKKVFHQNCQGKTKKYYFDDSDIETIKYLDEQINGDNPETAESALFYLEDVFLH
ncbi:hypothetical protein [Liquorilactobacillus mali]|uniref:Uncharacterized protein n=1 Tax=Liquorilactobacillus mali KCTC 3596 = DSM 20444 TaxID=1046596 RepID=A0A0R2E5C4_9LACO|nr:hypothetical protein [Liquorilactobacillus mali]KRN10806.1 hypothetical protein FD00_GL002048 [Liquorilactobacillus mali KCTC 3596 = DSM 20444]